MDVVSVRYRMPAAVTLSVIANGEFFGPEDDEVTENSTRIAVWKTLHATVGII
jgi:hypothetical protein